jgi:hypothetical protein
MSSVGLVIGGMPVSVGQFVQFMLTSCLGLGVFLCD